MSDGSFKILVADDDGVFGRHMVDFLKERGFQAQWAPEGRTARKLIGDWKPHFVIVDLTLQDGNAFDILNYIKAEPSLKHVKVIVISIHKGLENVKAVLKAGATDFVIKPFKNEDMLTRLVFHIQSKREIAQDNSQPVKLEGGDIYLQLIDIVLREAVHARSLQDILFKFTKMAAITLKAVRCNIIAVSDDRLNGTVMASSDDKNARGIVLDLNRYPEVIHVVNTEKPVVIEDLEYDPQMAEIKKLLKNISFNSLMVAPLFQRGEIYGVISARMDKTHSKFNERDIRFMQLVSMVTSLSLSSDIAFPHEFINHKRPTNAVAPPAPAAEQVDKPDTKKAG